MSVNQGGFIEEVFDRFLQDNPVGEAGQANYVYVMREVIQPIETETGVPICELPLDEVKRRVAAIPLGMSSTFRKTLSYLNRYREWYMNRFMGVFRLRDEDRIHIEDLDLSETFRSAYYCTDDEAIGAAERHWPVDDGYLDGVLAALYWLGYSHDDALSLQNDEVSIEGNIALVKNTIVRDKPIVDVLNAYKKQELFSRNGVLYSKAFGKTFLRRIGRKDGERQNKPMNQRFLIDYLIAHSKEYEKAFSILPLQKFGKMDRLWVLSQTKEISREDIVHEFGTLSRIAMMDVTHDIECYFKLRREL